MRIFLINPSEKRILENAGDRVPLGLLSIAANLRKNNYDVKVFDLNHTSNYDFQESFVKDKPEAVGISVYTSPSYKEAIKIAKPLKGLTRLIGGGYHATAMPETLLPYFDAVVLGEGENSFIDALHKNGTIPQNYPDLKKLPNPARELLDMSNYGVEQSGKRTATLISSRGCFGRCSFCFNMSKKVRFEPLDKMKQQIDQVKKEGFESIYFVDDIFTMGKKRMEEITNYVCEKEMPFRITTRADLINRSKLEILANNGCEWLSLGIESGDNEILKKSNKMMTTKDNYEAVRLANDYGIKTKGFFIIGLPSESKKTARKTIDFSLELKDIGLKKADFYYLCPFPGTPIWRTPEQFGIEIMDYNYTKYLQIGKEAKCYINTEHLKSFEIEEFVKEAKEEWKN